MLDRTWSEVAHNLTHHDGAVLVEQHDEWEAGARRYLSEGSMRQLEALNETLTSADAGALTGVVPILELTAA